MKFTGPGREGLPKDISFVIDGGWLLYRVPNWRKGITFERICQLYKEYVILHYGRNTTVIFDGGYECPSTKDTTHLRRSKGRKGKQVRFNKQMKLSMKEDFLLNKSNKQRFQEMLTEIMNEGPLSAIQALGDADGLIVSTALDLSKERPIAIVGEDTDLLVLALQHSTEEHEIFLTAPAKLISTTKPKLWDIAHVRGKLEERCGYMALVHALLGCDTTSRIQNIGKRLAFLKLLFDLSFKNNADTFYKTDVSSNDVINAGEKLLLMIFGGKEESLNELRFSKFCQKVATSTGVVNPESLCPTSNAAGLHSLRVYNPGQNVLRILRKIRENRNR